MIFVLAPDSFKESMTAQQACAAMERGIKKAMPDATCIHAPLADGGEGTMQALVDTVGGTIYHQTVTGPLGMPVTGAYAILSDGETGVVELASASGLHLVPMEQRNPLLTTTYGTGELIRAVLDRGIKKLIIGLGGSATNDGATGIAQALGVKFLDKEGVEIAYGGGALSAIASINTDDLITRSSDVTIEVACDVSNPLTGEKGASAVFGPQKGATKEMIASLDQSLGHLADKIKEHTGKEVRDIPGAGAAGGSGAGLVAFLGARLVKGIDIIIKHSGLEGKIKSADIVFTGEGSIDQQTLYGKTVSGVIEIAARHNKPVIAFAGKVSDAEILYASGLTAAFSILPSLGKLADALANGEGNLENTTYALARVLYKTL